MVFIVTIRFPEFYARGLRNFDKLMFLVVKRLKTNCCCIPALRQPWARSFSFIRCSTEKFLQRNGSVFQSSIASLVPRPFCYAHAQEGKEGSGNQTRMMYAQHGSIPGILARVLQSYARYSHFPVPCTCMVLTIATLVPQIFNYVLMNIIISTHNWPRISRVCDICSRPAPVPCAF